MEIHEMFGVLVFFQNENTESSPEIKLFFYFFIFKWNRKTNKPNKNIHKTQNKQQQQTSPKLY